MHKLYRLLGQKKKKQTWKEQDHPTENNKKPKNSSSAKSLVSSFPAAFLSKGEVKEPPSSTKS